MFEEAIPDMFKIEVLLSCNPLRLFNADLLKGKPQHTRTDTGFNRQECQQGLQQTEVYTVQVDILRNPFSHAGHSGLTANLTALNQATLWASIGEGFFINKLTKDGLSNWNAWLMKTHSYGHEKQLAGDIHKDTLLLYTSLVNTPKILNIKHKYK